MKIFLRMQVQFNYISNLLYISLLPSFLFLAFLVKGTRWMLQILLWIGSDPLGTLLLLDWFGSNSWLKFSEFFFVRLRPLFAFAEFFFVFDNSSVAFRASWFCSNILWSLWLCLSAISELLRPNTFSVWIDIKNPTKRRRMIVLEGWNTIFSLPWKKKKKNRRCLYSFC